VDRDDDMEYTEDAIDNMILEFSRDKYKHGSKIKCLFVFLLAFWSSLMHN
jgi:hypothetical protein